jgi:hypothetical protein
MVEDTVGLLIQLEVPVEGRQEYQEQKHAGIGPPQHVSDGAALEVLFDVLDIVSKSVEVVALAAPAHRAVDGAHASGDGAVAVEDAQ